jgi:hypothetical protein
MHQKPMEILVQKNVCRQLAGDNRFLSLKYKGIGIVMVADIIISYPIRDMTGDGVAICESLRI